MNLVSLLILPAVIGLRNNTGVRLTVALVALVILGAAILYAKRGTSVKATSEPASSQAA
jgi:K(+)-stimulated pyrophosphate-energized sodium pump